MVFTKEGFAAGFVATIGAQTQIGHQSEFPFASDPRKEAALDRATSRSYAEALGSNKQPTASHGANWSSMLLMIGVQCWEI